MNSCLEIHSTKSPMLSRAVKYILSGAAVGVVNVVTWIKNFVIGLIVSVYLLASRKKFGQQGKLILYSLVKPRWADLIMEEVRYADRMTDTSRALGNLKIRQAI